MTGYQFIFCGLFKDAVNGSDYVLSNITING
jgi:hypothetical protein